jgi:peptidyl-prolyl cis-trans isomerase C
MLGQLARGDCAPEFEAAVFAEVGCGVLPTLVRTRHGFHVVGVERRVPGHRMPFEAAQGQIASRLARASLMRALSQYAEALETS